MKAILLVAGYAKRLYPITENFPKALLTIGGKTMLDRLVEKILSLDPIDEVHIVSNHKFIGHFRQWAADRPHWPLVVHDDGTVSEADRLGAIGDLSFVLKKTGMDEDILVCAGDNWLDIDWQAVMDRFQEKKAPLLLVQRTDDLDMLRRFAVVQLDANGKVTHMIEKPEHPASDLAAFALYLYPHWVIPMVEQYLAEGNAKDAPGYLAEWISAHADTYVFVAEKPCYDIGTVDALRFMRERYGE